MNRSAVSSCRRGLAGPASLTRAVLQFYAESSLLLDDRCSSSATTLTAAAGWARRMASTCPRCPSSGASGFTSILSFSCIGCCLFRCALHELLLLSSEPLCFGNLSRACGAELAGLINALSVPRSVDCCCVDAGTSSRRMAPRFCTTLSRLVHGLCLAVLVAASAALGVSWRCYAGC